MGDLLAESYGPEWVAERKAVNAHYRQQEAARLEAERRAFPGECFPCRDTGWLAGVLNVPCEECPRGRAVAAELRRQRFIELWRVAGITPRSAGYSLETYPLRDHPILQELWDFLTGWDGHQGLLLSGDYGVGKTGLLVSVLREIAQAWSARAEQRRPPRLQMLFVSVTDFLQVLRDSIAGENARMRDGESAPPEPALLDRARRVSLLALDDLGAEKPTEWVLDRLFTVLNYRHEQNLPTFVTSNYGLVQLEQRVGMRVADRLREDCHLLEVGGPNLRHLKPREGGGQGGEPGGRA